MAEGDVAFWAGRMVVTLVAPGSGDVELFPGPAVWPVVPGGGVGEAVDT